MIRESPYLTWAKAQPAAELAMAGSGVPLCTVAELGAEPDAPLTERNDYGWAPLVARLAHRYGVPESSVVVSAGTSLANQLAMATVLSAGDRVLVEHPVYDPLALVPPLWGATVGYFHRYASTGYRIDVDGLAERLTPATRLVVLSNLHNPTGALTRDADLRAIADLAERHGFYLLVDEVYREWLHGPGAPSSATFSPRIIVTSSVTKVWGLGGLRIGWILAEPGVAERMRRFAGLFDNVPAHPSERLAARALDRADAIIGSRRALVTTNRAILADWVQRTPGVAWAEPPAGAIGWVDLGIGDTTPFVDRLAREYGTSVVPGHFFGEADHVRIALGIDSSVLRRGLERIAAALATGARA
jgi:aspartate/methionine/tyrosine aminotransferase